MDPFDTSADAASVLVRGWRAMSPARRMALVESWSADVRALATSGIRTRHPDADDIDVLVATGRLLYGTDVIDDEVERVLRGAR